ncbi:proto-oncogene tyrosine-protein kinase LCK-like [Procambarus clarkii]|uniref:proto-oncogene tyrosine-protein kinase LCK-like n=1 Tax=Procambarus clarkii TaxID=6728 RepID=UPI00374361C2
MNYLSEETVNSLLELKIKSLGSGSYGKVALVNYKGKPAALKVAISSACKESLTSEARLLSYLNGTGGAPILLAVADKPLAILTSYKGSQRLYDWFKNPSYTHYLIYVGLKVGSELLQIHKAGIVHNDLKSDNIMVEGSPANPEVSIIDFGLACRNNEYIDIKGGPDVAPIYAPEVLRHECSTFAADVFSYGVLMLQILKMMPMQFPLLEQICKEAVHPNPKRRPSLGRVLHLLMERFHIFIASLKPWKPRNRRKPKTR